MAYNLYQVQMAQAWTEVSLLSTSCVQTQEDAGSRKPRRCQRPRRDGSRAKFAGRVEARFPREERIKKLAEELGPPHVESGRVFSSAAQSPKKRQLKKLTRSILSSPFFSFLSPLVLLSFLAVQRVKKENAMAERFWATRKDSDLLSEVSVRTNATSRSTDTTVLKARLEALESELAREREYRQKVEKDLRELRTITED